MTSHSSKVLHNKYFHARAADIVGFDGQPKFLPTKRYTRSMVAKAGWCAFLDDEQFCCALRQAHDDAVFCREHRDVVTQRKQQRVEQAQCDQKRFREPPRRKAHALMPESISENKKNIGASEEDARDWTRDESETSDSLRRSLDQKQRALRDAQQRLCESVSMEKDLERLCANAKAVSQQRMAEHVRKAIPISAFFEAQQEISSSTAALGAENQRWSSVVGGSAKEEPVAVDMSQESDVFDLFKPHFGARVSGANEAREKTLLRASERQAPHRLVSQPVLRVDDEKRFLPPLRTSDFCTVFDAPSVNDNSNSNSSALCAHCRVREVNALMIDCAHVACLFCLHARAEAGKDCCPQRNCGTQFNRGVQRI